VKLDFAILAEHIASANKKLYIHGGGLRRIDAPELPIVFPVGVAASFTASLDEAGNTHEVSVEVIDPNGVVELDFGRMDLEIPHAAEGSDWDEITAIIVVQANAIAVQHPGWYVFRLALDGEHLTDLRLRVVVTPL
jgi:hypothetical protein